MGYWVFTTWLATATPALPVETDLLGCSVRLTFTGFFAHGRAFVLAAAAASAACSACRAFCWDAGWWCFLAATLLPGLSHCPLHPPAWRYCLHYGSGLYGSVPFVRFFTVRCRHPRFTVSMPHPAAIAIHFAVAALDVSG